MQSRIPFRPSVFSTLLIAALLAAAALIADTARADHFTGSGSNRDSNYARNDTATFGRMCVTLGATRYNCFTSNGALNTYVCDTREQPPPLFSTECNTTAAAPTMSTEEAM